MKKLKNDGQFLNFIDVKINDSSSRNYKSPFQDHISGDTELVGKKEQKLITINFFKKFLKFFINFKVESIHVVRYEVRYMLSI